MHEMYEGLRAVCAVLEDVEAGMPHAPALRLARWHLRLLARLAASHVEGGPGETGSGSGPGSAPLRVALPEEARHVVQ